MCHSKLEQAARQALEALEVATTLDKWHWEKHCNEAITALREALAEQAEQEPVLHPIRRGSRITCIESGEKCIVWATSHTDCWVKFPDGQDGQYTYAQIGKYFAIEENQAADEAYERGLKEGVEAGKKIAEQAEQSQLADASLEPVAWLNESEGVDMYAFSWRKKDGFDTPLYAAPVRTKDLTDDEIDEIFAEYGTIPNTKAVRAVITADREKNRG